VSADPDDGYGRPAAMRDQPSDPRSIVRRCVPSGQVPPPDTRQGCDATLASAVRDHGLRGGSERVRAGTERRSPPRAFTKTLDHVQGCRLDEIGRVRVERQSFR
jgi:hypothetical protein